MADRVLEASRRAHSDIRYLTVVDTILESLQFSLQNMRDFLDGFELPIFVNWGFDQYIGDGIAAIKEIDLFDCPSRSIVHPIAMLPRQAEHLLVCLESYNKACDEGQAAARRAIPTLHNSFNLVWSIISSARAECQKAIGSLETVADGGSAVTTP